MDPKHIILVKRIAHHMMGKLPASIEVADLIQVGLLGLVEAMERYVANDEATFETFATQRIRGAMLDELRSMDHLSRGERAMLRAIEAAGNAAGQHLGRAPSEGDIAAEMGLSLAAYQEKLQGATGVRVFYLEDLFHQESDENFLDRFCIDDTEPMDLLVEARRRDALVEAIKLLPKREQYVMSMLLEHEMNQEEIGAVLGVTGSRVSQLQRAAVARLQKLLREH